MAHKGISQRPSIHLPSVLELLEGLDPVCVFQPKAIHKMVNSGDSCTALWIS